MFEVKATEVFRDLKETMVYKEDTFAGVYIFNYEAEAIKAEVTANQPAWAKRNPISARTGVPSLCSAAAVVPFAATFRQTASPHFSAVRLWSAP